ncbi:hypothetical protein HYE82_12775 [Streptomyces sp. BR123]|uniref:hypothetical protein n=1 Tax=Streptomyces sp. BR123 TaxID=2749828 RepID=UPI0015C41A89|nr:hypothetical protein [Streptomyces sp. BR123]NXY95243.1 hypothetical protein [Streptomyces sp. BR123]
MVLKEGLRVKLAADLEWAGAVTPAGGSPADTGAVAGSLSLYLAAGIEGTVERVNEHRDRPQTQDVREYVRLKSLLDDFGHQMPPGSRRQLEEQIGTLEPAWSAHQEQQRRATVRVRFDNGFVLDGAHEELFTSA